MRRNIRAHSQALDKLLVPARNQRCAIGDALRGCVGFYFNLVIGYHAIDQAFVQRFARIEHTAFEQNFQRYRTAHQRQQARKFAVAHGEAQLVDRHAKAAGCATDAQVAHGGNFQTTADTRALDQRQRRMLA